LSEQYIGCHNSDETIICDSIKKECCTSLRDILLLVDLEKHINGDLVLSSCFSYGEDHADFLAIKVKKDKNGKEKLELEIIEFKNLKMKSDKDEEKIEQLLLHAMLFQLLYFYAKLKNRLNSLNLSSKGKTNLCDFLDIENIKLKIVVPQGTDQSAWGIKNKLKLNYKTVLRDLISTPQSLRSSNAKEKLDEIRNLIAGTNGAIIDKIVVETCNNLAINPSLMSSH